MFFTSNLFSLNVSIKWMLVCSHKEVNVRVNEVLTVSIGWFHSQEYAALLDEAEKSKY